MIAWIRSDDQTKFRTRESTTEGNFRDEMIRAAGSSGDQGPLRQDDQLAKKRQQDSEGGPETATKMSKEDGKTSVEKSTCMAGEKPETAQASSVQIYGLHLSDCGYCKSSKATSLSYGIVSNVMRAEDYEELMLIGWRRSGTYFYKPTMFATCCPAYTIRLKTESFIISKSQRQVVRRVERYLAHGSVLASHEEHEPGDAQRGSKAHSSSSSDAKKDGGKHELTIEMLPAEVTDERYELYKKVRFLSIVC
jgi:Arginine-tRNA-protein transferase, N terminus